MSENTNKDVEKEILKVTFKAHEKNNNNNKRTKLLVIVIFIILGSILIAIGTSLLEFYIILGSIMYILGFLVAIISIILLFRYLFRYFKSAPKSYIDYTKQECTITNKRVYGHKINIMNLPNRKGVIVPQPQREFFSIRVSYIDHVIIDADTGDLIINYDVDKSLRLLEVNDKFTVLKTIEDLALEKETF